MDNAKYIGWAQMLQNANGIIHFIEKLYPNEAKTIREALRQAQCYFQYVYTDESCLDRALELLRQVRKEIDQQKSTAWISVKETDPTQLKCEIVLIDGELGIARDWTEEQQAEHQKKLDVYHGFYSLEKTIGFLVEMIRTFYPDHYPTVVEKAAQKVEKKAV